MSGWREPYQKTQSAYDQALSAAAVSTEAVERAREWKRQRPELEGRIREHIGRLRERYLGRARRFRPISRSTDPRLKKLRREGIGFYRKKLKRLRKLPRSSWPAQRYHLGILYLTVRLVFAGSWSLVLILLILLYLWLDHPRWVHDLVERIVLWSQGL